MTPQASLEAIKQAFGEASWHLMRDVSDVQVYRRDPAEDLPVYSFRTVTVQRASRDALVALLRDVVGAMSQMNRMFRGGGVIAPWPIAADPQGCLVRTCFALPFPLTDREFVHGVHVFTEGPVSYVVYTPAPADEVEVQEGMLRSPIYPSGQRITDLGDGRCRVEHLMVYDLGGALPVWAQNLFLSSSHVGAYIEEWRGLGRYAVSTFDTYDPKAALEAARGLMEQTGTWAPVFQQGSTKIALGRTALCPRVSVRTSTRVRASLDTVVDALATQTLRYLPQWNVEYLEGERMERRQGPNGEDLSLLRVRYKTPMPLSDREYVYAFSVHRVSPREVWALYHSVSDPVPVGKGAVRAYLFPSVHRFVECEGGEVLIEHLLATDLAGSLGPVQDRFLGSALIKAHQRDISNQQSLFRELSAGAVRPVRQHHEA